MESPLLRLVNQFLDALEQIQAELVELFEVRRQALIRGSATEMQRLNEREQEYGGRLQGILAFRNRILAKLNERGENFQNLEQVVSRFRDVPEGREVLTRIENSKRTQAQLRQASWTHWIISHRCYNHYTEILDLIAHQGQKEPGYSERPHQTVTGGTMLDTSI